MLNAKSKRQRLEWTEPTMQAFEDTKTALSKCIRLTYRKQHYHLSLFTDASDIAISAILVQTEKPLTEESVRTKETDIEKEVLNLYSRPIRKNEQKKAIYYN